MLDRLDLINKQEHLMLSSPAIHAGSLQVEHRQLSHSTASKIHTLHVEYIT